MFDESDRGGKDIPNIGSCGLDLVDFAIDSRDRPPQ